jgi:type 1 glutamine amidotransferase
VTRSIARVAILALLLGGIAAGPTPARGAAQEAAPSVLVFSATYGFRHPSISTGNATLTDLAEETGAFEPTFTEDPADLSAENLPNYDIVLFNQTTGRFPLAPEQRQALERYWGCGGGTVGIHASTDANYGWPAYAELWGAQFSSHPQNAGDPAVRLLVENGDHPANAAYAGMTEWVHQDELYRWQRDVRGRQDVTPLLALDETTVRAGVQEGAEAYWARQPLSWTKTFRGAGRVYYNNLGHNDATYGRPEYRQSLVDGITWVSQVGLDSACFDGEQALQGPGAAPAPGSGAEPCVLSEGQTAITLDAPGEQRVTGAAAPRYFGYGKRSFVLDLSGSEAR